MATETPTQNAIVFRPRPEWATREVAEQMRDAVLAAAIEAGYPDAKANEIAGQDDWYFTGAPRDVFRKAGELVRIRWGLI